MTATELVIALFLSASCSMADITETKLGRDLYQITTYHCLTHEFKVWQRFCREGRGFYSRPFLIQEARTGESFYLNRFGEVMAGRYVEVGEVYMPACGA